MTDRIVDISTQKVWIHTSNNLLILEGNSRTEKIPFQDIGAIILSYPSLTISQQALSQLAENNIPVIICGNNKSPTGMLLPYDVHSTQSERFRLQIQASKNINNRAWKQIVQYKFRSIIKAHLPPEGQVRIIHLTDAQYGKQQIFQGKTTLNPEKKPEQLSFF